MKQITTELLNFLNNGKHVYKCDLYTLELASGLVFRYANYDMDITIPTGEHFTHKGPIFSRSKVSLNSKITVDKMTVTMTVDSSDTIGGTPMLPAANNGGFDCSQLSLYKCFMSSPGVVVGIIKMFSGDIEIDSGGGLNLKMEVKSIAQRLDVEYPLRKYYPTCPYTLYSAGCGLDIKNFIKTGTITGIAADYYLFNTDLKLSDGYLEDGGIEFTSGVLTGLSSPIKYSSSNGQITLLIPCSQSPAAGDTFRAYPGCNKTVDICTNKFNNRSRNRSTPYIPLKETIV